MLTCPILVSREKRVRRRKVAAKLSGGREAKEKVTSILFYLYNQEVKHCSFAELNKIGEC
jgi:hypothetical protein